MDLLLLALIAAWAAIIVLGLALSGTLRRLGEVEAMLNIRSTSSSLIGTKAPPLTDSIQMNRRPTIVLFASEDCVTCRDVVPEFDLRLRGPPASDAYDGVVAYRDGRSSSNQRGPESQVVHVSAPAAFSMYGIKVVPTAVAVDENQFVTHVSPIGSRDSLASFLADVNSEFFAMDTQELQG